LWRKTYSILWENWFQTRIKSDEI